MGYDYYFDSSFGGSNYLSACLQVALNLCYLGLMIYSYSTVVKGPVFKSKYIKSRIKPTISFKTFEIEEQKEKILCLIALYQFVFYVIGVGVTVFDRAAALVKINPAILLPLLISKLRTENEVKWTRVVIITVAFLYWLVITLLRDWWYYDVPYSFFWSE